LAQYPSTELAIILHKLAAFADDGGQGMKVRDTNGNTVGTFIIGNE